VYEANLKTVRGKTGVAVLGSGYWGINYVRILSELPDAYVAVVCDRRPNRLDEVARRFPLVRLTDNVDEALAIEGVDAAVVCTQAATHREVAGQALECGKHVLVEKPLTLRADEADELIDLAHARGRVLLVGHTFVYNPGVQKVKTLVDEGALGDVYYLYGQRTNLGPIRWDVNAVWDLAPHDIAIFNHLLGQVPGWVSAVGGRVLSNSREDVGFISLGYANNVIGHIHVSWADPHKVRDFVVVGSDARVAFNDLDPGECVRVFAKGVKRAAKGEPTTFGEYHFQIRDGDITSPPVPVREPLKHVCGHFLHCVRRGDEPLTDGGQGRDVVAVMEAIDASLALNGTPVPVQARVPKEEDERVRAIR